MASNSGRSLPLQSTGMAYIFTILLFFAFTTGATAFGAGTTSSDECKWRHGDIENALLGLMLARTAGGTAFTKMDVKRVYFGNWLRDYSQMMDVGFLKVVGPNVLRTLVALFAFMTFGYGTGEFEVSDTRLGVYRPEEHLDNPKHYANGNDAKKYDSRLRGVVDEDLELFPDDRTGMKGYIANERLGVTTSAGYIRKALGRCIKLGREHARKKNIKDFDDALRYLGAALHTLEDFPAHSNYVELCLRELGERGVFPHVGTATELEVKKDQVFPLVTGSFGSVHFLSSVIGGDPRNLNPSELQQLEEQITSALEADSEHGGEIKLIKEHFASLPKGLLNEQSISNLDLLEEKSKEKQEQVKTRADDGEPVDLDVKDLYDQIYPFLEMHDRVVREIVYGMEEVPTHAATYENIQKSLSIVTFSLIAPYILPVLQQARIELAESANELIATAADKEFEVFSDPYCSDPVHTIVSKDNAANVLSEPAGRVAVEVVKFVVPLIMRAWDEPEMDMDPLINYILGVFHHPVCRDERNHRGQAAMFAIVRDWWTLKSEDEQDELRMILSMDGIKENKNWHGEDSGHGSLKPIAGVGILPGDATGTIFQKKPDENTEAEPDAGADKAPDPPQDSNMGSAAHTPVIGMQDGARPHRRKRDREGRTPRDRDDRGSQSPEKRGEREHRRRRHHDEPAVEAAEDLQPSRDPKRRHRGDGRPVQTDLHDRDRQHHHRHRDEQPDRVPVEDKPKEGGTRVRFSQMFSQGINYLGFGSSPAPADPEPARRANGLGNKVKSPRSVHPEDRHRKHRHRHESERGLPDPSPTRQRTSRRRERSKSDEEAPVVDDVAPPAPEVDMPPEPPQPPESPVAPPADVPDTSEEAPAAVPSPGEEGDHENGSEKKVSRRRSTRKREGHHLRREGGQPLPIPEEGPDYFHAEQDAREPRSTKASKVLGMDIPDTNGDGSHRKPRRRHTDRDIGERHRHDETPPSRGGFLGRIVSKADRFLGREPADESPRPLERRKTFDRAEHTERPRRHHSHDDEERRRRKRRSAALPAQIDPPDFAEAPPMPDDNVLPEGDEDKKQRRQKSSPNSLQFDVPSDGSGSGERKKSRSPRRQRDSGVMPELQDVSGLGIDTGDVSESKPHRRRHRRDREAEDAPPPSPRKDRRSSKRGVKEVNFEDVESGDALKKEKARRHRSVRDESRDDAEGSRERRRRSKRESAVFGGYDIRD